MKFYKAELGCGCCHTIMEFESEETMLKAYEATKLGSNQKVIDDKGTMHNYIDTFYIPIECDKDGNTTEEKNKLQILVDRLQ